MGLEIFFKLIIEGGGGLFGTLEYVSSTQILLSDIHGELSNQIFFNTFDISHAIRKGRMFRIDDGWMDVWKIII